MANLGYSFTVTFCLISASFLIFGVTDGSAGVCNDVIKNITVSDKLNSCLLCVTSHVTINTTTGPTCIFNEYHDTVVPTGIVCAEKTGFPPNQTSSTKYDCDVNYGNGTTTTTPLPPTTPSTATTTSTTAKPTTTTIAPTPTSNGTTVPPPPGPGPKPSPSPSPAPPNVTTTAAPVPSTTPSPVPGPTPAPSGGGFSFATFLGGIVFTLAIASLAYVAFRLYRARTGRNYSNLDSQLL